MYRMLKRRVGVRERGTGTCTACVETKEGLTFHPYVHPYELKVYGGHFCPDCLKDFDVKRLIIATKYFKNGSTKKRQGKGQQHLVLHG